MKKSVSKNTPTPTAANPATTSPSNVERKETLNKTQSILALQETPSEDKLESMLIE